MSRIFNTNYGCSVAFQNEVVALLHTVLLLIMVRRGPDGSGVVVLIVILVAAVGSVVIVVAVVDCVEEVLLASVSVSTSSLSSVAETVDVGAALRVADITPSSFSVVLTVAAASMTSSGVASVLTSTPR